MKFTTEIDLRNLYRKKPFTSYKLEQDERLTPGARQFLNDKSITYGQKEDRLESLDGLDEKKDEKNNKSGEDLRKLSLIKKLESIYISFLLGAKDLIYEDIGSSKYIVDLSRIIYDIGCKIRDSSYELTKEKTSIESCSAINESNIFKNLGSCHDITDFYMNLEVGKSILVMKKLQLELEGFYIESSLYNKEKENIPKEVFKLMNYILNSLSQKICYLIGGKRCQRKS